MSVLAWLATKPDTIQVAVIGGIVALLGAVIAVVGVILNNAVSHYNLGRQLAHDRSQKEAERALALRREVYLGAAEHLFECVYAILALADPQQEQKEVLNRWKATVHQVAKLHLLANPTLLEATLRATELSGRALWEVWMLRTAVVVEADPLRKNTLMVETLRRAVELTRSIQAAIIPVAAAAREELGIKIDELRFADVMTASSARMEGFMAEMLERMEQLAA